MKKISPNRVVNLSEPTMANIADILFAYSTASPCMLADDNPEFVNRLEKTVQEKFALRDYFNTLTTTKI
jgi:hypothetical protein